MKYPGAFILNEYGTNKELAKSYGVSERTIYRWKSKAKTETGARARKPTRPRASTLERFKGTRKELAKKYGVSERTAYRWLQKAKEKGAEIEPRQKKSKYPGADILLDKRKNSELSKEYDVSERTIARWKRRARTETEEPFEIISPIEPKQPENGFIEEDFYNEILEIPEFDETETPPASDEEMWEVPDPIEFSETVTEQLNDIGNMLTEYNLLNKNSLFSDLSDEMKTIYLNEYIQYQWDMNPYQFNQSPPDDPNGPDIFDPEKITNINIWGDEFETWLKNKIEIDNT